MSWGSGSTDRGGRRPPTSEPKVFGRPGASELSHETRNEEGDQSDDPADESIESAEALEDGSLDPDELEGEPGWWGEGSDDED